MALFKVKRFSVRRSLPSIVVPGCKAWYQAKNNTTDVLGNADATAVGSVAYDAGQNGSAFRLDGTTAYVQIPYKSALAATTNQTITCWFKLDQLPAASIYSIFGQSTSGNDNDLLIGSTAQNLLQFFGFGTRLDAVLTLAALTWYHVAVTIDSVANVKALYLNGLLNATTTATARVNSTSDWSIGESVLFTGRKFKGLIGDVRMYNTTLTATQVKQVYADDLTNLSHRRRKSQYNAAVAPLSFIASLKMWLQAENSTADTAAKVTAAFIGTPTYDTGVYGQAFSFDGSTKYVRITYNSNLMTTVTQTMLCWFRLAAAPGIWMIMGQSTSGNDNDLLFNGATMQYYGFGASPLNCTASFSTLTWYHVALVIDTAANTKTFYINGVAKGSTTAAARANSINDWSIGESLVFGGRKFNGLIDEAQVYNAALTQAQVIQIMNGVPLYAA